MTSSTSPNKPDNRFNNEGASDFARIAEEIFAPVYPVLAEQISRETGITAGLCVDIGAGPGHLGLALAQQQPALQVVLYDAAEDMLELARKNSCARRLTERVRTQHGPAERLPFPDQSARLAVSRGSIFFWDDQVQGINEIHRILAPGGAAFIGGGFGNAELQAQIQEAMKTVAPDWDDRRRERLEQQGCQHFEEMMKKTQVTEYRILKSEAGLWIRFEK